MLPPSPFPTPLVSPDWLRTHLPQGHLVLLDCRFSLADPRQGRQAYQQGHLPGALYCDLNADLSSPVERHGGRHPLPDMTQFIARLEAWGINSHPPTPVIAYDATQGAFAARLWWLLRYVGHEAVAVLDGGISAWQRLGYPLEKTLPAVPQRGQFQPQLRQDWVVDRAQVIQAQAQGTRLVDARSPERYRGEVEPIDPIAGAIPGAVNFFWQHNLDDQGQFRSPDALADLWNPLSADANAIFYCGSGVTACVNILAQAVMQRPLPKLYVGGWSDWCTYL